MGGPYASKVAGLGGLPTVGVDVPICAIFLVLFISGAVGHMTTFQINRRRGHKFIPSAATFGFCMSRTVACIIRIVWACYPHNVSLAIAAQIFVAAGVLILFILNLLYAQRMALYAITVVSIIMLITVVIQSAYTLNANTHRIDRDIQVYGVTYFAIVSFLPLPIVLALLLFTRGRQIESPGHGSWAAKGAIVITAAVLLCLGASFRAATTWMPPRPATNPPPYDHKACFYIFDFGIDITVVMLFLFARVDKRFWVPNGSSQVRHYRGVEEPVEELKELKEKVDVEKL
ncbi:hypothetical protein N7468_003691 [Penicillium chermesinum]|uniref:Uncharacterized protein n=1 Tax=Penicillium chermesinum TaxID=63820 RepID=A0A9W9P742_9EURO|nr:uncharacterized protein N7468_003691 [Penicillium chermesinum]KAJ5239072.1 hypothetical protein N7468_003691 [Penicillium chermesinum]